VALWLKRAPFFCLDTVGVLAKHTGEFTRPHKSHH
jgi:hypothetical protein